MLYSYHEENNSNHFNHLANAYISQNKNVDIFYNGFLIRLPILQGKNNSMVSYNR